MTVPFTPGREPLLCDGAMGTELHLRGGVPFGRCFDELNLTRPDLVRAVHLDYIQAGADIIETNTFGANAVRLAAHGLEARAREINAAAVRVATEARALHGQHVWIAGAMGPLGRGLVPMGPVTLERAREAFREQAEALAAGVDLLMLETFGDLRELREAVLAARDVCKLPVIAQMAFNEEGRTLAGDTAEDVATALESLGVDAAGANCSIGSEPMLRVIEAMARATRLPLSAQPNAGFPALVSGRYVYVASPEHMARYARRMVDAGAAIVGGCCGTTPAHIAAMRDAVRGARIRGQVLEAEAPREAVATPIVEPKPTSRPAPEPTQLAKKLAEGKFVVTVEVFSPRGFDAAGLLKRLEPVTSLGYVDAINVTDSPRAQVRMSAVALCSLIQLRLGIETVLHMALRHRNLVALHSDLLGAHALGVRNVFIVMGDPPRTGDYPSASAVSDITPSGLMALLKAFNRGESPGPVRVDQPTSFCVGGALNVNAADPDKEMRALEKKVQAGVDFLLGQPVWDPEAVVRWRQRFGDFPVPFIQGVLPLRSTRHAEFLHNEVPGMTVPDAARQRLRDAPSDEDAGQIGLQIARDFVLGTHSLVSGFYVMPPFGHFELVEQLFQGMEEKVIGKKTQRAG